MLKRVVEGVLVVGLGAGLYYARAAYLRPPVAMAPLPTRAAPDPSPPGTALAAAPAPAAAKAPTLSLAEPEGFTAKELERMKTIHGRFATGDFVGALKLADDSTVLDTATPAYHAWVVAQMPVLLTTAGWSRLKVGDCEEATTFLRRSEALKRSLETAKGLAACYYKQKNLGAARDQFAYYLEKSPEDAEMQVLYADVLESEGAYDDAVRHLEKAAEAPADKIDQKAVQQRLASMKARAKENAFQQVETSRNFRLLYRAGDHEDLVSFALQTLEDALDEYIENFAMRPPPAPIEVIFYPAGNFRSIAVGGPEWAEGLFDGRMRIPIRDETLASHNVSMLREVLRHELVHALFSLASDARNLPSWFEEGMAQRLSCATPGCGAFQFPPTPGAFLTSQSFFTPYTSFDAFRAGRAYRQSLYLIFSIERLYGDTALRRLAGGVGVATDPSSDGLLKPLDVTFESLRTNAADLWDRRTPLGLPPAR